MFARIDRPLTSQGRTRVDGFTLIEVLISMAILVVIVAIVYGSFSAVATVTEQARASAEEMRIRQFLARNLNLNFSTLYIDPMLYSEQFAFVGTNETGPDGPMDSVEFCSSAPLMGGTAMPGILKRVRYGAAGTNNPDMNLDSFTSDGDAGESELEGSEALMAPSGEELDSAAATGIEDVFGEDSPSWSVPVRSFDVAYFDGADWVEEWDSLAMGRLPWGVHIRINFEHSDEAGGLLSESDPESADFETFIPIPLGIGVWLSAEESMDMAGAAERTSDEGGQADGGKPGSGKEQK